mmetsp:Transcript_38401/g.85742  ORF Transcript_38401/g.85742 Transcript_38401/m.85742 type:complete len:249 (+) Transcript_38401:743-1489(+)
MTRAPFCVTPLRASTSWDGVSWLKELMVIKPTGTEGPAPLADATESKSLCTGETLTAARVSVSLSVFPPLCLSASETSVPGAPLILAATSSAVAPEVLSPSTSKISSPALTPPPAAGPPLTVVTTTTLPELGSIWSCTPVPAEDPVAAEARASYCSGVKKRVYGSLRAPSMERIALYAASVSPSFPVRLLTVSSFLFFQPSAPRPLKVPSTNWRFTSRHTSTTSDCSSDKAAATDLSSRMPPSMPDAS